MYQQDKKYSKRNKFTKHGTKDGDARIINKKILQQIKTEKADK